MRQISHPANRTHTPTPHKTPYMQVELFKDTAVLILNNTIVASISVGDSLTDTKFVNPL